jgi:hypothetical protein
MQRVEPGMRSRRCSGYRLRFVPAPGYTGTAMIGYRAWDRTAGRVLDWIDTDGGLDSFSVFIETATVTVRAV